MSFFPLSRQTHAYAVRGTRVHQPLRSRWPILEATKYVIYLVIRSRTGCYMEQRPHRERAVECRKKCLTVRIQVERPLSVWRKIVENPHPKGKLCSGTRHVEPVQGGTQLPVPVDSAELATLFELSRKTLPKVVAFNLLNIFDLQLT